MLNTRLFGRTEKETLFSINGAPLSDSEGNFDGMVSTIEDVTDRKRERSAIA